MMFSYKNLWLLGIPLMLVLILIFIAKSNLFLSSPSALSIGVTIDLVLTIPMVYFFIIRKTKIPNTTTLPVFVLGIVIASLILPEQNQSLLNFIKSFIFPVVELTVFSVITYKIYQFRKAYKQNKTNFNFSKTLSIAAKEFLPERVAEIFVTEISMIYYGFFAWKELEIDENHFSYHKKNGVISILSIFSFLILIETATLHFLIQLWSQIAAWILTGISLYTFIQIIALTRSLTKLPVIVNPDNLELQFGIFSSTSVQFDNIESVEILQRKISKSEKIEELVLFGDFVKPNVLMKLKEETVITKLYGFKKSYTSIVFYVDEPEGFIKTLNSKL